MIINPSHVQLDFEFLLNITAFIKRIKQNKNNILIVKLKKIHSQSRPNHFEKKMILDTHNLYEIKFITHLQILQFK